jgi:hypothetical protein
MGKQLGHNHPNMWKSGPDPIDHRLYNDCQRARAQAWYRGEDWYITEEEYIRLWREDDRYLKKGRTRESVCLVKIDKDLDWTLDNVHFITRLEHFKTCSLNKGRGKLQRKQKHDRSKL